LPERIVHRLHRPSLLWVPVLAAGVASGCVEDSAGCPGGVCLFRAESNLVEVVAVPSGEAITAGERMRVSCLGRWDDGSEKPLTEGLSIAIEPSSRTTVDGAWVTAEVAGAKEVRCRVEAAPELTQVPGVYTVLPAEPATVTAEPSAARVVAGQRVEVRCRFADAFGNPVEERPERIRTQPSRGTRIDGMSVIGELAGDYSVSCAAPSTVREIGAPLTVEPAAPTRMVAELERYRAMAGETTAVRCRMADDFGNEVISTDAEYEVTPTPDVVAPSGVLATTSGDYWVTCRLPAFSLDSDPVLLRIVASWPASMQILEVRPARPIYARTEIVEPVLDIRDVYGNRVAAADVALTGIPAEGVVDAGFGQAMLVGNGQITLVATVTSRTHMNQLVDAQTTLNVDGEAPEVEITFPRRAEMVVAQPNANLTIRGRVTDGGSGVASLVVNGQMITPNANGDFTASMRPGWGVNPIEVSAFDQVGNQKAIVQSFSLASSYRRVSPTRITSGRSPDGIIAHLGQAALDDNADDVDDLATIARLAIENTDIMSLIPNPVTTFNSDCSIPFVTIRGALNLHVDSLTFARPRIDITAIQGGLRVRAEVSNLVVRLRTSGDVCEIGVGVRGTASASRVVVTGDIQVSANNGRVVVAMPSRNVSISGLDIDLDLPAIIDWAVDGIIGLFKGMIRNRIESAFGDVIRDQVPRVAGDFLSSLTLDTGFDLPAPLSMRLSLNSVLGMLQFYNGGGDIGLDSAIYATGRITPEPRGGIVQETQTLPSFQASRALGVAIGYDQINQALYSLWYGGGLDLDLGALIGTSMGSGAGVSSARARGLLPPIVRPTGDAQYPLELQVGDLRLDVQIDNIPVLGTVALEGYATVFVQANASVNRAGEIQLALGPTPRVMLQLDTPLEGIIDIVPLIDGIERALELLVPQIFSRVIQNIPIPSFDLSTMAGGYLPPGIVLGLGNAQSRFHPSYLILEGDLVQVP
jgi:hypothetical protein